MPNRIRLSDIANATGVHFTTVARVLRGARHVSAITREKVQRCAEQLGYTRDPMLSALSAYRKTSVDRFVGSIGFLTSYDFRVVLKTNVRERRMFNAAQAQARENGFKLEPIRADVRPERLTRILVTRGIQGLILPPLKPAPGPFPELDWSRFSIVALNYSITNLRVHRVCFSQGPSMHLHLHELSALGYRRIGFVMQDEINIRSGFTAAGAFLVHQHRQPKENRVEPYFPAQLEMAGLKRWLRQEKPDCVILQGARTKSWVDQLGYRVPEDLGVSLVALESPDVPIAGIDEQDELLGRVAVDTVISLLRTGERGLPDYPRLTLVEGRWVPKPTLRRQR